MLADRYGLPISTSSEAARAAYIAGCDGVLSAAHGERRNSRGPSRPIPASRSPMRHWRGRVS